MCKCRDTGGKSCRWEHPSDSWNQNLKAEVRNERKAVRIVLRSLATRTAS